MMKIQPALERILRSLLRLPNRPVSFSFERLQPSLSCGQGELDLPAHQSPLFLRSVFKHVAYHKPGVVPCVGAKTGKVGQSKDPAVVLQAEQTRRHGRAGTNNLRMNEPSLSPVWLESLPYQSKVGSRLARIRSRIAGGVAAQAGRGTAGKQLAGQPGFMAGKWFETLRDIW